MARLNVATGVTAEDIFSLGPLSLSLFADLATIRSIQTRHSIYTSLHVITRFPANVFEIATATKSFLPVTFVSDQRLVK